MENKTIHYIKQKARVVKTMHNYFNLSHMEICCYFDKVSLYSSRYPGTLDLNLQKSIYLHILSTGIKICTTKPSPSKNCWLYTISLTLQLLMQLVGLSSLAITLLLLLWNKVLLYSSACPQTHTDSASWVTLLQLCVTTPCTTSFLHMWRNVLVVNLLAGEMAQWVKCLLCTQIWSLDPK